MYQRNFRIGLFFIIVCLGAADAKPPDTKWLDRCRDTKQCPYGAGVYYDDTLLCDGVVIGKHHILTAASCFNDIGSPDPKLTKVRVDAVDDNTGIFYNIKKINIHSFYKKDKKADVNYDIAVLKIADRGGFEDNIRIALLPYKEFENYEEKGESFAWVHMKWRKGWDYLTHHPVVIYNSTRCHFFRDDVTDNHICGIVQDTTADTVYYAIHGGPLIYKKHVIGISSEPLGVWTAQLFVNVYKHMKWISQALY